MAKVVHVSTSLQTTFGIVDDNDNVIQHIVVPHDEKGNSVLFNINKLDKSAFDEVFNQLVKIKSDISDKISELVTSDNNTNVQNKNPSTDLLID